MKTRIIFLDDEPQTSRRLRTTLGENGYEICVPQTIQDAFYEINVNHAELVIHCAHRTKTYWELCDQIFAQYPQFPSLHLATGPKSEIYHSALKGPFHQKMRPLTPHKDFLKRE